MRSHSVLLVASLGLGGCIVVSNNPPPTTTHNCTPPGGAVPTGVSFIYKIQAGGSTVLNPGTVAGYGITANTGGSYRAVWTGDAGTSSTYREFCGSIYTPGRFVSITPGCTNDYCHLESDDVVSGAISTLGGERIDFDTFATTGLDGLDFVVSAEPVYFDMNIDGSSYPQLVTFQDGNTGNQASVHGFPFGLTTH